MVSEAAAKISKEMQSGSTTNLQATVRVQKQKAIPTQGQQRTDYCRCSGKHKAKFKGSVCHFCKKRGHLSWVCCTKQQQKNARMGQCSKSTLPEDQDSPESTDNEFGEIYHVHQKHNGTKVILDDAPPPRDRARHGCCSVDNQQSNIQEAMGGHTKTNTNDHTPTYLFQITPCCAGNTES